MFTLLVHTIDLGLGMSSISWACSVKVFLYFSRYPLFESCNIWIVCSLRFRWYNKPLVFALTFKFVPKICKQREGTFQGCRFLTSQLCGENLVKLFFFFSGNFSPITADFFHSLFKVKFCIVIVSLGMMKQEYISCMLITQYVATVLFGFLVNK